jgi:hypothetical protein
MALLKDHDSTCHFAVHIYISTTNTHTHTVCGCGRPPNPSVAPVLLIAEGSAPHSNPVSHTVKCAGPDRHRLLAWIAENSHGPRKERVWGPLPRCVLVLILADMLFAMCRPLSHGPFRVPTPLRATPPKSAYKTYPPSLIHAHFWPPATGLLERPARVAWNMQRE